MATAGPANRSSAPHPPRNPQATATASTTPMGIVPAHAAIPSRMPASGVRPRANCTSPTAVNATGMRVQSISPTASTIGEPATTTASQEDRARSSRPSRVNAKARTRKAMNRSTTVTPKKATLASMAGCRSPSVALSRPNTANTIRLTIRMSAAISGGKASVSAVSGEAPSPRPWLR